MDTVYQPITLKVEDEECVYYTMIEVQINLN